MVISDRAKKDCEVFSMGLKCVPDLGNVGDFNVDLMIKLQLFIIFHFLHILDELVIIMEGK